MISDSTRRISSVIIVVVVAYFLLGLVGVLPAQYDIGRTIFPTEYERSSIEEYPLPYVYQPFEISSDEEYLWIADSTNGVILKMNKSSQTFQAYQLEVDVFGITNDEDYVWFSSAYFNCIGRFTKSNSTIDVYGVPTSDSFPTEIVDDGTYIWFVERNGNKIGRLDKSNPNTIDEYTIPTENSYPSGITSDDDYIWFSEVSANKLGMIYKSNQTILEFYLGDEFLQPYYVANDEDFVWLSLNMYSETSSNMIWKFDKNEFTLTSVNITYATYCTFITCNDEYLFVCSDGMGAILRIDKTTERVTKFYPSTFTGFGGIALDENYVWFSEYQTNSIGRLYIYEGIPPITPKEGDSLGSQDVEIYSNLPVQSARFFYDSLENSTWNLTLVALDSNTHEPLDIVDGWAVQWLFYNIYGQRWSTSTRFDTIIHGHTFMTEDYRRFPHPPTLLQDNNRSFVRPVFNTDLRINQDVELRLYTGYFIYEPTLFSKVENQIESYENGTLLGTINQQWKQNGYMKFDFNPPIHLNKYTLIVTKYHTTKTVSIKDYGFSTEAKWSNENIAQWVISWVWIPEGNESGFYHILTYNTYSPQYEPMFDINMIAIKTRNMGGGEELDLTFWLFAGWIDDFPKEITPPVIPPEPQPEPEQPTPQPSTRIEPMVFYTVGVISLVAVGIFINRPEVGQWRRSWD